MAYSLDPLKWTTLTRLINEIKGPQNFLQNLLFSDEQTLSTETAELSYLTGGVVAAPYVRKNGEAIMVAGLGQSFATVAMPNIRIKRPFTPSDVFTRRAGTSVFVEGDTVAVEFFKHIARDLKYMRDQIENTVEVQASTALRGIVSYEVADQEVFTITFPRSAGNAYTVNPLWSTTSNPEADIHVVKRLLSDGVGLSPTHVLLGRSAATAFLKNARVESLLDNRRIVAGGVSYTNQFNPQGAIFLGDFCGVQVWEYGRQISVNGTATSMIRSEYAEFVCATPDADWGKLYGAIPDFDALMGRSFQGKIFAKSWIEKDPSAMIALAHSRPLCVPRRPDASVSLKVV